MFKFLQNFLYKLHRDKAWSEAHAFADKNQFAEAANVYVRLSAESLTYNELIYADDCHDALKYFLKAKDAKNALQQARNALDVLAKGGWTLEDQIDALSEMVAELGLAGYATEAEAFAQEVNKEFETRKIALRVSLQAANFKSALEGKAGAAMICPQCGGNLPTSYGDEIKCPFCGYVVKN